MSKTLKIIVLLLLVSRFTLDVYSQKYDQHVTVKRGDYKELSFRHTGDVTAKKLTFVVKLTKSEASPRLIMKQNIIAGGDTTEISTLFLTPYTYIKVKLLPEDTYDRTSTKYFYDIESVDASDSTKVTTLFDGEFRLQFDVQTPFDGTALPSGGTRVTTVSLANGTAPGDIAVWDTTLTRYVPVSRDSIWSFLNVDDTIAVKIAEEMLNFNNYSLTFLYPTTNEDILIDRTHKTLTIDSVFCSTKDSSITFNLYYASTRNGSTTGVLGSNQAITTPTTLTSFANATIPANNYLIFQFYAVAGLFDEEFYCKIYYR